jgi:predicted nucleic acid-binding protein
MTLVIDANVAVKWFVDQEDSDRAIGVIALGDVMLAPDLIVAEVGNALWMHAKDKDISLDRAVTSMSDLPRLIDEIVSSVGLSDSALRLAMVLNHSVYGCFYAALALDRRATFITADRRFAEKLRVSRRLRHVKVLDEIRI